MTAGHYAIEGCTDQRISVLYFETTPVTGKTYLCCCGNNATIQKYTLWGWWAICFTPNCSLHKRYATAENAARRCIIHNTYHPGKLYIYEGTKHQMFTPLEAITQDRLGDS